MKEKRKNSKWAYGMGAVTYGAGSAFVSSFLTWVPIVLILISIPIFWKYELDNETMKQMEKELEERRNTRMEE